LIIPNAAKAATPFAQIKGNHFCGRLLVDTLASAAAGTICSKSFFSCNSISKMVIFILKVTIFNFHLSDVNSCFTANQIPFNVQFLTDAYTVAEAASASLGFRLTYFLTTC